MKNYIFLLICFIGSLPSCKKEFSTESPTISYDSAAIAFIDSSGITDTVEWDAINTLVLQLKNDSLWDKFLAIYPMIGGTEASTKWNLIDPRDLDNAYRITWHGSPDFETTGVTCWTRADWGDTHLKDAALLFNNSAISFYSGTQNQTAGYDMGCSNGILPYNILAIYEDFNADIVNTWFNAYGSNAYQPANTVCLSMMSSNKGEVVHYVNGTVVSNYGPPDSAYTYSPITIGQVLDDSRMGLRECRFASIGKGLTNSQAFKFYNAVHIFETNLNR